MENDPHQEQGTEPEAVAADAYASLSNAALFWKLLVLKLKALANYLVDGLALILAAIALVVAVVSSNGNKTSQAQLAPGLAQLDSLKAGLLASQGELEKTRAALAQERAWNNEARREQTEQMAQIVLQLSKLQQKMKISPTLEEQLYQSAATPAATPMPVAAPASASAALPKTSAAPQATVSTGIEKKPASQVQLLREAIEKFNRKDSK